MYDPENSRWLSPDPVMGTVTDPQSLNVYAYVLNTQVLDIDSSGLAPTVRINGVVQNSVVEQGDSLYMSIFTLFKANGVSIPNVTSDIGEKYNTYSYRISQQASAHLLSFIIDQQTGFSHAFAMRDINRVPSNIPMDEYYYQGQFLIGSFSTIELGYFERLMCVLGIKTDIRVNPVINYHEKGHQIYCNCGSHTGIHTEMDIGGIKGDSIYASISGKIKIGMSEAEYNLELSKDNLPSRGVYMTVTSNDGRIVTLYAHLSKIILRSGYVGAGTKIAEMGSIGNSSGPHLHFEVSVGGKRVDPRDFLNYRV